MIDAMIAYHSEEKFNEMHAGMIEANDAWFEKVKADYLRKKKQLRHMTHKRFQDTCDMAMTLGGLAPAPAQPSPAAQAVQDAQ